MVGAGGCCHPDGDAVDGGGLSKLATVSRFPTSIGSKGSGNGKHTPSCQLRHRLGAQSIIAKIDASNIASTHSRVVFRQTPLATIRSRGSTKHTSARTVHRSSSQEATRQLLETSLLGAGTAAPQCRKACSERLAASFALIMVILRESTQRPRGGLRGALFVFVALSGLQFVLRPALDKLSARYLRQLFMSLSHGLDNPEASLFGKNR